MTHTKILGTGSYMPSHIIRNQDLEKIVDTSDAWITSRTGIKSRPITVDENTSDLAFKASLKALEAANLTAENIDLIIVATITGDYVLPGVAQLLQRKLGAGMIPAFDINAACSGFVYALDIADKMIQSEAYKHILIVGADILSKITDFSDRNTCVLFADGAGAMVLGPSSKKHIKAIETFSKGDQELLLYMDNYPLKKNFKTPPQARPFVKMQGSEVFKFAVWAMPYALKKLSESSDIALENIELIVAHQANERIIKHAAKSLKIPMRKMFMNIDKTGNTSAASVPIAIDEAVRSNRLKPNQVFATVAFGGGLTWGGAIIEY